MQLAIPRIYRETVIEQAHDHVTLGHVGTTKTLHQIRIRFFWPKMKQQVRQYVNSCHVCKARKSPNKLPRAPMGKYLVGAPFERIHMDITGPYAETDEGFRYALCICDAFSKFAICVPIASMSAKEVCQAFIQNWCIFFGIPLEIHGDRGTCFESEMLKELCTLLSIKKTRSTVRNPASNGQCEKTKRTFIEMLNCVAYDNPFSLHELIWLCCM